MAALPSPTQVAGNHSAIYEAYYNVVDPNGFGTVGGMEAARFLKRSALSDVILSKIWDLSDPGGRGCLDKSGMFVAMKLVALVQNGKDLNILNVNMDVLPPKLGDVVLPKPAKPPPPRTNSPLITSLPPTAVDWTVKPAEREKYDKLFESLQPINGLIPGNKVKNVLLESKLPFDTLGKIWDLADQDKDGMLNRHEFIAAMHLVYKALEKYAIPNTLPTELIPTVTSRRKNSTPLGGGAQPLTHASGIIKPDLPPPPSSTVVPTPQSTTVVPAAPTINQQQLINTNNNNCKPTIPWVVMPDEKSTSDALFVKSDVDRDGFVSGPEIKDVFLQSGVPQAVLAHIWALCDIKQSGKLNNEQFALAMWFIARYLKGIEPPISLNPDMIPPSYRTTTSGNHNNKSGSVDGLVENNNTRYSNPELDMISKDLEELAREKLALETDIAQKEADTKIKSGEIKSLQSELDTLAATLKQLENQKGEAQKRLNDLRAQVDKLRVQAAEQAETVAAQETELNTKKEQLEGLKQEEQRLEQQKNDSTNKLHNLTTNLQDTQIGISQAKALITQLEEQTRQMNDAIQACSTAIESGDVSLVPDTALRIEPDFRDSQYSKLIDNNKQNGGFDVNNKTDLFNSNHNNGSLSSGFNNDDLFSKRDPFKNSDAFDSNDAFASAFTKSQDDGFSTDPFGSGGGVNNSFTTNQPTSRDDPFDDAFGDSRKNSNAATTLVESADKDPFGCDPFAILHAPTRDGPSTASSPSIGIIGGGGVPARPTSPSPALPPKKSKPPPRPAPPRPMQPPHTMQRNSQPDLFESMTDSDPFSSNEGGFADFADFETKFHNKSMAAATTRPRTRINNKVIQQQQQQIGASTTTTISSSSNNNNNSQSKGMEFTDDPFRDYRYEDPFNISFDDDDDDNNDKEPNDTKNNNNNNKNNTINKFINNNNTKKDAFGFISNNNNNRKIFDDDDKFDPFGLDSGRQSVPLSALTATTNRNDQFINATSTSSNNNNNNLSGRLSVPIVGSNNNNSQLLINEDQQLAWAARESLKLEEVRQQRQLQEQADLLLAISLSKVDNKKL